MVEHSAESESGLVREEDRSASDGSGARGESTGAGPVSVAAAAGLRSLKSAPGMTAALARAVVRGSSNHLMSRILARSPLSDELRDVYIQQGKGALFDRLRGLNVSDPDVATMVDSDLSGDDHWLASNLVRYGPEASWPLHLKVEREMKGWGDSGGKGAVFELLRAAGPQPGNAELSASLARVFAAGSDDLWLARNLQQHGREASWPLHLKVEREMKGWGDSGGKGAVFELLRAAGAQPGNADLTASLARVFAPGSDDLWLATNLQQHGREASWPIHLRVEREMKGWGDSGGKGAVFDILRAAGAQPANADLAATLARVFAPGSDDIWLANNLQQHGPEASWPLHLKVEREMKGWGDSGGKAAVFNLLRAAGAQAGNADLTATLARVFASGTEDFILAKLLQQYGAESAWPAPVEEYQCPFDYAPQSSPGERILYNGRYLVVPAALPHYHELVATATNGSFDAQGGPAQKTFRTGTDVNRIDTGNFSFFIPAAFAAGDTASVTIELRIRSTGAVVRTRTWNFTARGTAPTTVRQLESGATEIAIGSAYTYEVGPALPTGTRPFYEHQTVLEEFQARVSNLDVGDMDPAWLAANSITDKAGLDAHLFGGSSNNGTFVINALDRFRDQHGGGQAGLDNAASHLAAPKEIHVDLPQTYTAGPGNLLGNFMVRRIRHAAGGYGLRKWQV